MATGTGNISAKKTIWFTLNTEPGCWPLRKLREGNLSRSFSLELILLFQLAKFKRLLTPLVVREIRERYADSVLGAFWALLHPALIILLYYFVFASILKVRISDDHGNIPFISFLLCGLLPWFAFNDAIQNGASSVISKRHIIKKVIFPAYLFPSSCAVSSHILHAVPFFAFAAYFAFPVDSVSLARFIMLALIYLMQAAFTVGLSMLLSALVVYVRDILQIVSLLLQVMLYSSGIFYSMDSVPAKYQFVLKLNPFTPFADSYHHIILFGHLPPAEQLLHVVVLALISLILGRYIFNKLRPGFVDVL